MVAPSQMLSDASAPATCRSTPAKRPGAAMPNQRPARTGRGGFMKNMAYEKAAEDHNTSSVGSKKRVPPGPPQGGKSVSNRVEEHLSKRSGGLANHSSVNIPRAPLGASVKNTPRAKPSSTSPHVLLPSTTINQPLASRPTVVLQVAALAPPALLSQSAPTAAVALPGATSHIRPVMPACLSDVSPAVLQNALLLFQQQLQSMFAGGVTAPSSVLPSSVVVPSRPVARASKLSDSTLHLAVRTCIAESISEPACIAKKLPLGLPIITVIKKQVDILLDPDDDAPSINLRHHHIVRSCKCSDPAKQQLLLNVVLKECNTRIAQHSDEF